MWTLKISHKLLAILLLGGIALSCVRAQDGEREKVLARRLTEAKTEAERTQLLANEPEAITRRVCEELLAMERSMKKSSLSLRALDIARMARHLAQKIGDAKQAAVALLDIGDIIKSQGDISQALTVHKQALEEFKVLKKPDDENIIIALWDIGTDLFDQGEFKQAEPVYLDALTRARRIGDTKLLIPSLQNMGNVSNRLSKYSVALTHYQEGLSLARQSKDTLIVAGMLSLMGTIYYATGQYDQALVALKEGKPLAEHLVTGGADADRALILVGNIENTMASVFNSQGNYLAALTHYQVSLACHKKADNFNDMLITLTNIANIYFQVGETALALETYREAEKDAKARQNDFLLAIVRNNLGEIEVALEQYSQAKSLIELARSQFRKNGYMSGINATSLNLGHLAYRTGNYTQALAEFQAVLDTHEAEWEAEANTALAEIYLAQSNFSRAEPAITQAVRLSRQAGNPRALWQAATISGNILRGQQKWDAARQAYEEAIATIESMKQQLSSDVQIVPFLANKTEPYYQLSQMLAERGQKIEALDYAERAKSQALIEVLRYGRTDISKAMTSRERKQEQELNATITLLNKQSLEARQQSTDGSADQEQLVAQLNKARTAYAAFQQSLYAAHPALRAQRGEFRRLSQAELLTLVPDKETALLEYLVTDKQAFLYVITRPQPTQNSLINIDVYRLPVTRGQLQKDVERFRQRLNDRHPDTEKSARTLYAQLLVAAQKNLKGKKRLTIVPDGPLWDLPFQALQSAPQHYLLEDSALHYVSSLAALFEMRRLRASWSRGRREPTLLAFGNPFLGKVANAGLPSGRNQLALKPLPYAEAEVRALQNLYGIERSRIYTGAKAREEKAKKEAGQYRILHFATHALIDAANPMYSCIILSQEKGKPGEDGQFQVRELLKLNLQADLVVLSACETGRGRVSGGEGVIGLSWSLFVAGCPTTIVSQWQVNDASTALLMQEFHRRLLAARRSAKTSVDVADILRQAELYMLHSTRYSHPHHWAGFVVLGDNR